MPIYEFKCNDCGKNFKSLIGVVAGNNEVRCPECGSKNLTRLLSVFAVKNFGGGKKDNGSGGPTCPTCGV